MVEDFPPINSVEDPEPALPLLPPDTAAKISHGRILRCPRLDIDPRDANFHRTDRNRPLTQSIVVMNPSGHIYTCI